MKNYKFWILMLFAAAAFAGCKNSDETTEIPVVTTGTPTAFDVAFKGGEVEIAYAVSTGDRPYVDSDSEWLQVVTSDGGRAKLAAAANDGAARSARVKVAATPWLGSEPLIFTINQAARPPLSERLIVTAEEVTDKSVKVVCNNLEGPELWYYYIVMTREFYEENVAPDSAGWVAGNVTKKYNDWKFLFDFFYDAPELVGSFADYYMLTNVATDELLFEDNIQPETDYVIVAFDLDPEVHYSGEISTCAFKTKPIPPVEQIDLTFQASIVMSGDPSRPYKLTLIPSVDNVRHFSYVAPQEEYQQMLAAFGGDLDRLAAEFYKQFSEQDILYKYVNLGVYENVFGGIEDTDGDGKVSLVVLACGMDDYIRINSKAWASTPFVLDAPGLRAPAAGYAPISAQLRPAVKNALERNWRKAIAVDR